MAQTDMKCVFDICEFYNMLIGGLVIGIIASFIFVWLTEAIRIYKFNKRYRHLQSKLRIDYDWIAYSMRDDNGRIREDEPNGSVMNLVVRGDRIFIKVKQKGDRISVGELVVSSFDFGVITYKYENEHEYGKRDCIIGSYVENGESYDYIFTIPTNNKVYYVKKESNSDQHVVKYNYGDELFIRKRVRE
jgi:hypothetical protein